MGDRSSGTIAIVLLRKTAEMSSDEFPHSSETILRNSYMDDISESVQAREGVLTLTSEIDKILEHDSFRIKGWAMPGEGRKIEQGGKTHRTRPIQHVAERPRLFEVASRGVASIKPCQCRRATEAPQSRHKCWTMEKEILPTRINIGRFSKIELLMNTTARILKLYEHYNKGTKHSPSGLSELKTEDVDVGEKFWIRDAQESINKDINKDQFIRLCPKYKDGLIVVAVRAEHWMQATWNRQEFILPPLNHQMIAEDEHRKGGHLGVAATVARIRCRFLITIFQRLVKTTATSASYARGNSKD